MAEVASRTPSLARPLVLLRLAVAVILGIHGFYRALSGSVTGFGSYLEGSGFPFGLALAWAITLFEMAASLLLGAGRLVRLVIPGFVLILAAGIVMVHAREGWFVVGAGRNGVELSVLLICCLLALFDSYRPVRHDGDPRHAGLRRGTEPMRRRPRSDS